MEIAVTSIIAQFNNGSIFSGKNAAGDKMRVRFKEPIWPVVGEVYDVTGESGEFRDQWGRKHIQIEADYVSRTQASGKLIGPWLEQTKFIGPTRASRLIKAFGDDLVNQLSDPEAVAKIGAVIEPKRTSLGHKIAGVVQAQFISNKAKEATAVAEWKFFRLLEQNGVTDLKASRQLWRLIGNVQAEQSLFAKPYLAASILGWKAADHLGQRLLFGRGDVDNPKAHPERLAGACDAAWRKLLAEGHTAASEVEFKQAIPSNVNTDKAIEEGLKVRAVVRDGDLLRAPGAAWLEGQVAKRLADIARQSVSRNYPDDLMHSIGSIEQETGLTLTDEQRDAVADLLRRPLGVLQGGAGVGKTTVMKVLISVFELFGGEVVMACVAGKAALTLSRATSTSEAPRLAYTMARLVRFLEMRKSKEDAGESVPIDYPKIDTKTLVVLDEASMCDTASLYQLLTHIPDGAHFLFVGDHGQLPPVGLGRVFHDLIDKGDNVANLTKVLRQAEDSPIPYVAAAVREGAVPELPEYQGDASGAFLLECPQEDVRGALRRLHGDLGGTNAKNDLLVCAALRETVNTFNAEMTKWRGDETVRLGPLASVTAGDPVVCTRNRYADGLFNGLLGIVDGIDPMGNVAIMWDGESDVKFASEDALGDIDLAYAITCHKAQGSAAKKVIIPLERTRLLTREWLYTAITRARETVVLVGTKEMLVSAVSKRTRRVTGLPIELTK